MVAKTDKKPRVTSLVRNMMEQSDVTCGGQFKLLDSNQEVEKTCQSSLTMIDY